MITIIDNYRVPGLYHKVHDIGGNNISVCIDSITENFSLSGLTPGEYAIKDALLLQYSPITSIIVNGDIIINTFYDNYYLSPGYVNPFAKVASLIGLIEEPIEKTKRLRRRAIKVEMDTIDLKSIKFMRSKCNGTDTAQDRNKIQNFEEQYIALQLELDSL
jgi:hypothetical protein